MTDLAASEIVKKVALAIDVERSTIERDIPGFVVNERVAASRALATAAIAAARPLILEEAAKVAEDKFGDVEIADAIRALGDGG